MTVNHKKYIIIVYNYSSYRISDDISLQICINFAYNLSIAQTILKGLVLIATQEETVGQKRR